MILLGLYLRNHTLWLLNNEKNVVLFQSHVVCIRKGNNLLILGGGVMISLQHFLEIIFHVFCYFIAGNKSVVV